MLFLLSEKYRPKTFDEVIGNPEEIRRLETMAQSGMIPHLLFYGPAGTGKTTSALIIKDMLKQNFLELNASDDRGIAVIRDTVKDFASTLPIGSDFKILFFDEADNLTKDAQQALRRLMEKYQKTCKFILSCNFPHMLIDPIRSRCAEFKYAQISREAMLSRLRWICDQEGISIEDKALKRLITNSEGDMRAALNKLEKVANSGRTIKLKDIEQSSSDEYLASLIHSSMSGEFIKARKIAYELIRENGTDVRQLISEMHGAIIRSDLADNLKAQAILEIAEADAVIVTGSSKAIQLDALLVKMGGIK